MKEAVDGENLVVLQFWGVGAHFSIRNNKYGHNFVGDGGEVSFILHEERVWDGRGQNE